MQGSPIDVLKTKIQYNSKTQQGGSSISVILQLYIIFLIAELRVRFFLPHAGTQSKVMSYVIKRPLFNSDFCRPALRIMANSRVSPFITNLLFLSPFYNRLIKYKMFWINFIWFPRECWSHLPTNFGNKYVLVMFYWKYSFYIYKIRINLTESSDESLIFFKLTMMG